MGATGAKQSQPVPGYGSEQTRIIRTTSSEVKGSPDAADAGLRDLTDEELGLAGQHRNPAALPSTLHHRRGALSDSESFAWASDAQEGDCLYELHLTLATATDLVNPFFFRRMRPYVAMFVGGQHTDSQPAEHCLRHARELRTRICMHIGGGNDLTCTRGFVPAIPRAGQAP